MSATPFRTEGANIIFIVGAPRSGTTWLQRLLASHPKVRTGQESYLFPSYIAPQLERWRKELNTLTQGRGGVGLRCYYTTEQFKERLRNYTLTLLAGMTGDLAPDEFFVEKTPSHGRFLPEIVEMLPGCRIIHILRDARDVVASMLAASRSWGKEWAPATPRSAAKVWIKNVDPVLTTSKDLSKSQFYQLRYEDLVASTLFGLKEICKFLQLEWSEEAMLEAIKKNDKESVEKTGTEIKRSGDFAVASGQVVKEPVGFVRKASPGSWRKDLTFTQKVLVWSEARETMRKAGYRWDYPWQ